MVTQDDRTPEQKKTHILGIVGRDSFMSGWGGATGGYSRAAWACASDVNPDRVYNWVKSRGDMKNVSLVSLDSYRPKKSTAHFHIYVVNADHSAAKY